MNKVAFNTSRGFVVPAFFIWVVIGLFTVAAVKNIYLKGGTPYEQSELAKYDPTLDSAETSSTTPQAGSSDLIEPVKLFYSSISSKQYDTAWSLLSRNSQNYIQNYDNFINGYKTTLNTLIKDIRIQDLSDNTVFVQLETSDNINGQIQTKTFEGTWKLVSENGQWKLDSANIALKSVSPVPEIAKVSPRTSPALGNTLITHDGTRTGPIVDYFEFCAGKTIKVYENERLSYKVGDKTLLITKGDIDCYENLLVAVKNNTGSLKMAEESLISQKGLPTLAEEIATIKSEQSKDASSLLLFGKGTQYTDSLGITHFQGDNGVTGTAYTDSLGFTHYSDSTGRTGTLRTDSFGITTLTDNSGNRITSNTNSLGITNFSGGGLSGTASTDSLGFTTYRDNLGTSIRCHTNSIGFTTCR